VEVIPEKRSPGDVLSGLISLGYFVVHNPEVVEVEISADRLFTKLLSPADGAIAAAWFVGHSRGPFAALW